jgi:uncharacterized protein YndB with AHSA1/START domain
VHDSVTVHMDAPAEKIFELVSDVTQIGKFSPETFEAEWLDGASGPAVGAKFRGHVKRNGIGPIYWTTCEVTICEQDRDFAFAVGGAGAGAKIVNTWRYQLEPSGEGTDVSESFELHDVLPLRLYWVIFGHWRGRTNRRGMQTTLERIKAVVEGEA